jgi:hypothetical protein
VDVDVLWVDASDLEPKVSNTSHTTPDPSAMPPLHLPTTGTATTTATTAATTTATTTTAAAASTVQSVYDKAWEDLRSAHGICVPGSCTCRVYSGYI